MDRCFYCLIIHNSCISLSGRGWLSNPRNQKLVGASVQQRGFQAEGFLFDETSYHWPYGHHIHPIFIFYRVTHAKYANYVLYGPGNYHDTYSFQFWMGEFIGYIASQSYIYIYNQILKYCTNLGKPLRNPAAVPKRVSPRQSRAFCVKLPSQELAER